MATVTDPVGTGGSGQSLNTTYSYFGNTGDQRLQEIKNLLGTTPLSDFQYTYNAVGTIATWTTQADSGTAVVNTLTYDYADQLTSAVQSGGGSASNSYKYDPAGNRLKETASGTAKEGQFNNLNELTAMATAANPQTIAGHTSGPVNSVTVDAVTATISNSTNFTANVAMPNGTNVVSVVAQPTGGSSNAITTQRYQVTLTGSPYPLLSYDANGNVLSDENGYTYKWDALNRVAAIVYHSGPYAGKHTECAYDGLSRRVQMVERSGTTVGSGTVISTKNYLWIGSEIAEERDTSNNVTKRFFPQGEQQAGTNYYYTRDHLGSVREMCSSTGTITSRMAYDPYGRTTTVSGTTLPTKQYAGYYQHQTSGLSLTEFRAYDSNTGRWLSRDPLGEPAGVDVYSYVKNQPTDQRDKLGLDANTYEEELDAENPGILEAYIGWLCANQARTVAPQLVPVGPEGGPQDGFRHCIWSCCMAKMLGARIAKILSDNHEKRNNKFHEQSPDDFRQDTANNANGRDAATKSCSCTDACLDKLKNGGLMGLDGKPMKYP